jgi:hypothetical protein
MVEEIAIMYQLVLYSDRCLSNLPQTPQFQHLFNYWILDILDEEINFAKNIINVYWPVCVCVCVCPLPLQTHPV